MLFLYVCGNNVSPLTSGYNIITCFLIRVLISWWCKCFFRNIIPEKKKHTVYSIWHLVKRVKWHHISFKQIRSNISDMDVQYCVTTLPIAHVNVSMSYAWYDSLSIPCIRRLIWQWLRWPSPLSESSLWICPPPSCKQESASSCAKTWPLKRAASACCHLSPPRCGLASSLRSC